MSLGSRGRRMFEPQQLFATYLRQQLELGTPDYYFSRGLDCSRLVREDGPDADRREPPREEEEDARARMAALFHACRDCRNCPLAASRGKLVFGAGNVHARLMVIGEAPGAEEDRRGLPFVGAAGELLTKMLRAIKLDRKADTFIGNVLKCRPPGNRSPNSEEIRACIPLLKQQIEIISPDMLLLLGRSAAQAVLNTPAGIGRLRGEIHSYEGIPVVVTYHPAALLRNADLKRPAWEDLQKVEKLLPGREHNGT